MAQGDPAGWESLGTNDPTRYKAEFRLNRTQGSGQVKQSVRVITNRSDGNYDVYETNFGSSDRLIYSYNASNNQSTIANSGIYNQIFAGPNSQQLSNLNQSVKSSTLKLAQNNVTGGANSISATQLQQLKNSPGYKSLSNAQTTQTDPITGDPPAPLAPSPGSDPVPTPIEPEYLSSDITIDGVSPQPQFQQLYYPINRSSNEENYDYLKINVVKLEETGLRTTETSFGVLSVEKRRKSKTLSSVFLPMQPGISDTNGVSWNEDSLNPFQAALGGLAAEAITTLGSATSGAQVASGAQRLFQGLINTGKNVATNGDMQKYISAYFAGQAVGTNLVARTTGAVLNNNLELLFNGPKLRSFRYSFRFTPREEDEAEMIRKIIRLFKREMAADKSTNGGLFLTTPNVFELEYMSGNGPHPFLNKIKTCALTDMSVNYTPDGTYMTYQDRSMTSYDLQLQFSELEPIYKEDYDSTKGKQGMGY